MKVSLILVGTELLSGMTLDTNSIYMAEKLNRYSLEIINKTMVRDNMKEIIEAITNAKRNSDLVILSGGLGPTIDDITKEAIAKYLDLDLIVDPEEYEELKRKFDNLNIKMNEGNTKEVEKPEGAISFKNGAGMAPAIYIDGIAAFPGVPRELYDMFPKFLDYYVKEMDLEYDMYMKDILVWGIPESHLDEKLKGFFTNEEIHCEFLVKDYGIIVRLQCSGKLKTQAEKISKKIYNEIGDNIFGEDEDRLEELVVKELKKQGLTISLAESCTGGALASKLIDVSGVSSVLHEGIVCYSNESKMDRLGVSQDTLAKYGAVSEETAYEMLRGLKTNVGIATTGIAGPGGGTEEKPVGTVIIGLKIEDEYIVKKYNFRGKRDRIRRLTVMNTLFKVLKTLRARRSN